MASSHLKFSFISGAVCNVLLTCCKDNVCRLWAETLLPSDSLLYGGGHNNWNEAVNFTNSFKRNTSSKERMQNALEVRSESELGE